MDKKYRVGRLLHEPYEYHCKLEFRFLLAFDDLLLDRYFFKILSDLNYDNINIDALKLATFGSKVNQCSQSVAEYNYDAIQCQPNHKKSRACYRM